MTSRFFSGLGWVIASSFSIAVASPRQSSIAWQHTFDGTSLDHDAGQSIVVAPTGAIYVAGTTVEEVSPGLFVPRMLTMSLGTDGTLLWSRVFGSAAPNSSVSTSRIGLQSSGRIVVSGAVDLGAEWLVACYEPNGTLAWSSTFATNSVSSTVPTDMAIDAADNIHLCGDFTDPVLGAVAGVATFGVNGQFMWGRTFDVSNELTTVRGLGCDASGNVYATGSLFSSAAGYQFAVVKLDANGMHVWTRSHGAVDPNGNDFGLDVFVDANGRVLAGGYVANDALTSMDISAIAYDAQGALLWRSDYDGPGGRSEFGDAVTFDATGRVFVGGWTFDANFNREALVVAYAPNGTVAWSSVKPKPLSDEQSLSIATDGQGSVFASGVEIGSSGFTAFAHSFDSAGVDTGTFSFGPSNGLTLLWGAAASSTNAWYCTGQTATLTGTSDVLTIAFDGPAVASYCSAGTSTLGCSAILSASGLPSATATNGFTLHASGLDGQRQGLFFYGVSGRIQLGWGATSSFLCVKLPTQRTPLQSSGGTFGSCSGQLALDWNQFVTANLGALGTPFQPGDVVGAQAWYRDPASSKTTALSDALEFVVQP